MGGGPQARRSFFGHPRSFVIPDATEPRDDGLPIARDAVEPGHSGICGVSGARSSLRATDSFAGTSCQRAPSQTGRRLRDCADEGFDPRRRPGYPGGGGRSIPNERFSTSAISSKQEPQRTTRRLAMSSRVEDCL